MLTGFSQTGQRLLPRDALQLLQILAVHAGHCQNGPMGGEQLLATLPMHTYLTAIANSSSCPAQYRVCAHPGACGTLDCNIAIVLGFRKRHSVIGDANMPSMRQAVPGAAVAVQITGAAHSL